MIYNLLITVLASLESRDCAHRFQPLRELTAAFGRSFPVRHMLHLVGGVAVRVTGWAASERLRAWYIGCRRGLDFLPGWTWTPANHVDPFPCDLSGRPQGGKHEGACFAGLVKLELSRGCWCSRSLGSGLGS